MAQPTSGNEFAPGEGCIGAGITSIIVKRGNKAIKRLMRYSIASDESPRRRGELEHLMEISAIQIRHEKTVYEHLGKHDDIITAWYDLQSEEPEITMPCMDHGSVQDYLLRQKPAEYLQMAWAKTLANAVAYCHKKNVLIADIGSRNCLLDTDFSLKLCDFGHSFIVDADIDITQANDYGVTVKTDIAQFGLVLYELCTGKVLNWGGQYAPHFAEKTVGDGTGSDPGVEEEWPELDSLPSTEGILFGEIIRKCWTKAYCRMEQIANDLAQLSSASTYVEPCDKGNKSTFGAMDGLGTIS
ncbi:hypothetical protein O1611_g3159 [Lasiodiplodia mahajangana]|uniref:Uncharacterized protein n=1 Tax=Lasiodiplodia mahajangana TaxID=1108764 RepID=A0ACC2JSU1_9PEZI|nr:hypothetical protein O1611_g3159 [Lasiodiplodia mahajangana]